MEVHFQLLLKWMRKGSRAIHRPLLGEKIDKIGYDKNKWYGTLNTNTEMNDKDIFT